MALAVSDNGNGVSNRITGTNVATLDLTTYSVGGAASLLIAFVHVAAAPGTVTVTWDFGGTNQVMTQVATITNTVVLLAFTLINPTPGQKTLHAAGLGTHNAALGALAYSGSDISTGIDPTSIVTNTGTGASQSVGPITAPATGVTVAGISATVNIGAATPVVVYRAGSNGAMTRSAVGTNTHTYVTSTSTVWCSLGFAVLAGIGRLMPGATSSMQQFVGGVRQLGLSGPSLVFDASMGVF